MATFDKDLRFLKVMFVHLLKSLKARKFFELSSIQKYFPYILPWYTNMNTLPAHYPQSDFSFKKMTHINLK